MVMAEDLANLHLSYEGIFDPRVGSYSRSGLNNDVSAKDDNFATLKVEPIERVVALCQAHRELL